MGTFPFSSFLLDFISCVGSFILEVNLRIQTNPQSKMNILDISLEEGFADFLVASITLHLVMNFIA